MEVKQAQTVADVQKCAPVLQELRPHLEQDTLVAMVMDMFTEGYQLAFVEHEGTVVATVGYRYLQFLYCGKHIYIDDLVTSSAVRGKGYASALLQHVDNVARAAGYNVVSLDSGHQRFTAHRLYLNQGYDIVAHHFIKKL